MIAAVLIYFSAIAYAGLSAKPVASDLAVVLGNEVLASGEASNRLKARLDAGIELYRNHTVPLILVSGGVGKSGFNEAKVMAQYLVAKGVPPQDILTDLEGINTMATATNTEKLIAERHFKSVVIVSQYYHIPRCMLAFRHIRLQSLSAAYPRYFELHDIFALLREGIALPVYFMKISAKNQPHD